MNPWPETQTTLIRRISDPNDEAAWSRFDSLYRPVIYRFARVRGLQHSDAEMLVSDVLTRVFRSATRWSEQRDADSGDGADRPIRFRAWLSRVAENALLNLVTRQLARRGTGGTSHQLSLAGRPIADEHSRRLWERERQQQVFAAAASAIQADVDPEHWRLFWQTHVDGVSIASAAEESSRSIGSVYAIRCRILRRLRTLVQQLHRLEET